MHSYISKRKFVSLALSLQFNFVSRIETATVLNSDDHIFKIDAACEILKHWLVLTEARGMLVNMNERQETCGKEARDGERYLFF